MKTTDSANKFINTLFCTYKCGIDDSQTPPTLVEYLVINTSAYSLRSITMISYW